MNNTGVNRVMIAIYASVFSDLMLAYRHAESDKDEQNRLDAKRDAERWERWILSDPYGFLSDPAGILQAVQRRYKAGHKHVKCPEFAKRDYREDKALARSRSGEIRTTAVQF